MVEIVDLSLRVVPDSFGIYTMNSGGGQNLERQNVERPIFRNFKITNIKITKDDLLDSFIFEFIFSLFINYLHNSIIFQIVKIDFPNGKINYF